MSTRCDTIKVTRERHKAMSCKVFEVKFDKSKLSTEKKAYLRRLFNEAKWLYNSILANQNPFLCNTKCKTVMVQNKDREWEDRELSAISAQMKQGIGKRLIDSIIGLSRLKKKGYKVGRLKFKSQVNSIPLKQANVTYKIVNDKYIKLQGFKKPFKVRGLSQIPTNAEIANANLIRKAGDFYLKITCFVNKEVKPETGRTIGLDFGIETNVTTSNGEKLNFQIPETKQVKKASRKMNKCRNGSKRRFKAKVKLQKQYKRLTNIKRDVKNKLVNKLITENDTVVIQDESLAEWHKTKLCSKKVQHSIMGGIISGLKQHPETLVIVDKYFASTQLCPVCGSKNKHALSRRTYMCNCGYSCDRDIHAAKNILNEGIKQIGAGRINPMLAELSTSDGGAFNHFKAECDETRSLYASA